jgi:hypothetical protein
MSRLAILKAATSQSDLATLLNFKPKALSYVLYKRPAATKYKTFQIPKRNGGQRTIKAPVDALKLLQSRLSDLLQDCVDEMNTAKQRKDRLHTASSGSGRSSPMPGSTGTAGGSSILTWRISSLRSTSAECAAFRPYLTPFILSSKRMMLAFFFRRMVGKRRAMLPGCNSVQLRV